MFLFEVRRGTRERRRGEEVRTRGFRREWEFRVRVRDAERRDNTIRRRAWTGGYRGGVERGEGGKVRGEE